MAYTVIENGRLLIDCTYQHKTNAMIHYLAFYSGDYSLDEFSLGGKVAQEEFDKYPLAQVFLAEIEICSGDPVK